MLRAVRRALTASAVVCLATPSVDSGHCSISVYLYWLRFSCTFPTPSWSPFFNLTLFRAFEVLAASRRGSFLFAHRLFRFAFPRSITYLFRDWSYPALLDKHDDIGPLLWWPTFFASLLLSLGRPLLAGGQRAAASALWCFLVSCAWSVLTQLTHGFPVASADPFSSPHPFCRLLPTLSFAFVWSCAFGSPWYLSSRSHFTRARLCLRHPIPYASHLPSSRCRIPCSCNTRG